MARAQMLTRREEREEKTREEKRRGDEVGFLLCSM